MSHPVSGPISPEELQRIAELPYGKASAELRKHDPAWGLTTADNPNIKWDVVLIASVPVTTVVTVEAPDEKTAQKLAMATKVHRNDWEVDTYASIEDIEVESTVPA
ncbi:hypothetical protein [Devosia sp.]|uniref:hypothetical protein n=1 Tax=Devosia sp. TaxID=1871048 RepID=UPI001AFCE823|nr:hypothetical protein [Devosia sp.]MBO9589577.1 hypothetical protein [Devosia sp.]